MDEFKQRQQRQTPAKAPMSLGDEILNLHDCFITADLLRQTMLATRPDLPQAGTPPERAITHWTVSDRARFERLWWAMSYVLVEAWLSKSEKAAAFFAELPATATLDIGWPPSTRTASSPPWANAGISCATEISAAIGTRAAKRPSAHCRPCWN